MGSTVVEKIINSRAEELGAEGQGKVRAGDMVTLPVDWVMSHDSTTPLAIEAFEQFEDQRIYDPDRIVIVFDHIYPPSPLPLTDPYEAALNQRRINHFCKKHGIKKLYKGEGVCHTLMIEKGYAKPWGILVGGDSHTVTYGVVGALGFGMGSTDIAASWKTGKILLEVPESILIKVEGNLPKGSYPKDVTLAYVGRLTVSGGEGKTLEFTGSTVKRMDWEERMPIGNMAKEVEAVSEVFHDPGKGLSPDPDAEYSDILELDVNRLEPLVACPHSPGNVKPVGEVEGIMVDQVFIGSCTNGALPDLRVAAKILKGRKVHPDVRVIIIPSSLEIYKAAMREGLVDIFIEAGTLLYLPPVCGPCLGRQCGTLGEGDVCLSTSNRNFKGRMGHKDSAVYLASPATAAATAIEGKIADPRRYL